MHQNRLNGEEGRPWLAAEGPAGSGLALLLPSEAAVEERLVPGFLQGAMALHRGRSGASRPVPGLDWTGLD